MNKRCTILALATLVTMAASTPSAAVSLSPGQIVVTAIPDEAVVVRLSALGPDSNQDVIASGGFLRMPIGVAVANGQAGPVVLVLDRTCCSGAARVIAVNPTAIASCTTARSAAPIPSPEWSVQPTVSSSPAE